MVALKRSKSESRLYEVKTNKEYSAVLLEIEEIKQEKAQIEEQILALMEVGEGIAVDIRGAEQVHAQREEQAKHDSWRSRSGWPPSRPTWPPPAPRGQDGPPSFPPPS